MENEIINIVDNIIDEKGKTVEMVIPILQAIQDNFNYLPEEALQRVCEKTDITPSRIYGISTFYSQFRHKPVGEHIIKVCIGTACHVKGAMLVYDAFKRELNIDETDDTDENGVFTVDKIACLGCCTLATQYSNHPGVLAFPSMPQLQLVFRPQHHSQLNQPIHFQLSVPKTPLSWPLLLDFQ